MNNKIFLFICLLLIAKNTFASTIVHYQGQIDFVKNQFDLIFNIGENPPGRLTVLKKSEKDYSLSLDLERFQTPFFTLSSQLSVSLEFFEGGFFGRARSQYSLVDYKPIQELVSTFELKGDRFYITSLSVGHLTCEGVVGLLPPYMLSVMFQLHDMPMDYFLKFWMPQKDFLAQGHVSGRIKVSGDMSHIVLKGNLSSFHGRIKKLAYDSIYLNAQGVYPKLYITDSRLTEADGLSFMLQGGIDLSDKKNFRKQIKALTFSPIVNDSESKTEWTIKHKRSGEEGSRGLKYFLRKEKSFDSTHQEGYGMLGVEQKVEF